MLIIQIIKNISMKENDNEEKWVMPDYLEKYRELR